MTLKTLKSMTTIFLEYNHIFSQNTNTKKQTIQKLSYTIFLWNL